MADFGWQEEQFARRADRISHARVATFLAAGICFLAAWLGESGSIAWFAAGGVLSLAFLSLVWFYRRVFASSERFAQLSRINREATARVLRKWKQVPLRTTDALAHEEALADDLDLFGNASLFHLVSWANTPLGIEMLGDWLLHPAEPATVSRRQQAVTELAPELDMRQELHRRGLKVAARKTNPSRFLQWAETEPWLAHRHWLKWASRCLPVLIPVCVLLWAAGVVPMSTFLVPFMANVAIGSVFCRQMHAIFESICTRHGEVGHYADLFQSIAEMPAGSDHLIALQRQTADQGIEACGEIQRLGQIMDLANLRFSAVHFVVQSVSSWDFHVLALLERWQRRNGQHVRRWFEVLAQWEALASLASLAHDNPSWIFPTIQQQPDAQRTVSARSLGHPLIPDDRRVTNDVTVGPPGTFLMVTGSNMSGKSTLLRAIGANVVLAQAGGPVCAVQLSMPPVLLATSMRIHDSLADGVSYYMAELRRLKQIVDTARNPPEKTDRILLYLLDEILQGTNTAERQIAVRRVLSHLLARGTIGAVSTHDLQLAAAPSLVSAGHAIHFRETIHIESGRHEMTFDYKLRQGLATTSNALKLLEMVGLGDDP